MNVLFSNSYKISEILENLAIPTNALDKTFLTIKHLYKTPKNINFVDSNVNAPAMQHQHKCDYKFICNEERARINFLFK